MTKKKDHLFYAQAIVDSVLRGSTATSQCGVERVFKRGDLDDIHFDICKHCMASTAKKHGDPVTIHTKRTWADLLELAYLDATSVKYTVSSGTTSAAWSGTYRMSREETTIKPAA